MNVIWATRDALVWQRTTAASLFYQDLYLRSIYSDDVPCLKLGDDSLGTRLLDAGSLLLGGVGNLAVVNDDGVAGGPLTGSPTDALAELGLWVGGEDLEERELANVKMPTITVLGRGGRLTMKSSLIPLALPQADMTQASLKAMTTIWSTPAALSLSAFWMYEGRWEAEQVGVKAPGTETRTTFFFLNS